jgi:hypothetical protein
VADVNAHSRSRISGAQFDVIAYGAKGDGVTDSLPAIRTAMEKCHASAPARRWGREEWWIGNACFGNRLRLKRLLDELYELNHVTQVYRGKR